MRFPREGLLRWNAKGYCVGTQRVKDWQGNIDVFLCEPLLYGFPRVETFFRDNGPHDVGANVMDVTRVNIAVLGCYQVNTKTQLGSATYPKQCFLLPVIYWENTNNEIHALDSATKNIYFFKTQNKCLEAVST